MGTFLEIESMTSRRRIRQAAQPTRTADALLEHIDLVRLEATRRLDPNRRAEFGQFLTPIPIANLMASMFTRRPKLVRLLDAGAGIGSLTAAYVAAACAWAELPEEIDVTLFEVDPTLVEYSSRTLEVCRLICERQGVRFRADVRRDDFIVAGVAALEDTLFGTPMTAFTAAILNPPYRKIHSDSQSRRQLRSLGIETSNLYTAFMAVAGRLLASGGELVAITPRSFCNGPYFRPFRKEFLSTLALRRIHVFETRTHAFEDDDVLQENIITYAAKTGDRKPVLITSGVESDGAGSTIRLVPYDELVRPSDPEEFIRIAADETEGQVAARMEQFMATVEDLGLSVSTGRVVDFRAKPFLRDDPDLGTAPLIYPIHFDSGYIAWPKPGGRKPNALAVSDDIEDLLVPAGFYVLVKRFSAKEERRRIVAAVLDPARVTAERLGFENHLNYFHADGRGLPESLAKGLAVFLNSSLVDAYFRQFNGHTQVNATDLRSLRYPPREALEKLGNRVGNTFPEQRELDEYFNEELLDMVNTSGSVDPVQTRRRIDEAIEILKTLGLPREQQNERSGLTLLALLGLQPETPWRKAQAPLMGITPMMTFFSEHYGKTYAPNTRETVRRFTVHQFIEAGLIIPNPDRPDRPVNSPKAVYQIEENVLALIRTFGSASWKRKLENYLHSVERFRRRYAGEREMKRLPVKLPSGAEIHLSSGGQNVLVKQIVEEFCPRFTPGAEVIYIGDAREKWACFDRKALEALGVTPDAHGKMPDVLVHDTKRDWLVLIEAVTSHGPVNTKRREELRRVFARCRAGLVFVTAFLTRTEMKRFLPEISWETEVWVADAPSHLIHFDGERFLGPYEGIER